ncbi:hypothetical protein TRAPUB_4694 [Trametes pubescens]|uniref:Uncharacterized protein n=1 Tax=Trametes pubescens TaxID=154538 RepID=A0A1M2VAM8_TRAPU|nr:hypothetical protein TRAPUB_4694 [Trametes pubescens]
MVRASSCTEAKPSPITRKQLLTETGHGRYERTGEDIRARGTAHQQEDDTMNRGSRATG